jgi:hypothetical protein
MGVTIGVWRARIGCFSAKGNRAYNLYSNGGPYFLTKDNCMYVLQVLCILLVIGGVECNPGPGNTPSTTSTISASSPITAITLTPEEQAIIAQLTELSNSKSSETLAAISDCKATVNVLTEDLNNVKQDLAIAKEKILQLEKDKTNLHSKRDDIQNELKKNNVIVFGLEEDTSANSPKEEFCSFVFTKLGITLFSSRIIQAYRIGKSNNNKKPLFVQLDNSKTKEEIMANVSKLKGSKVSVCDDLTPQAREIKKFLLKRAAIIHAMGHSVKIRKSSLIVGESETSYENL